MENYDIFSKFYDQTMGDRTETAKYLSALIKENNPSASTVLELACGTGEIMRLLSEDYDVSGLELSSGMLKIAKEKLPYANFYKQSMAGFDLPYTYDVILCVFDSINHLLRFSEWKKLFKSAQRHLSEGGIFIFDMNTEEKLEEVVKWPAGVYDCAGNKAVMDIKSAGIGIARWNIKIHEKLKNGKCRVHEENICEKSFPLNKVKGELEKSFHEIEMKHRTEPIADVGDRIYFICKK
jgi:predicted TPR repeat methyltransferase